MKKLLFFGLVAAMFASCSTEVAEQVAGQTRDIPQSIVIDFEEGSRVHLENGKSVLNIGDTFHVFNKINHSDTYTYNGNVDANGSPIIELTNPTYYTTHTETDKVVVVHCQDGTPTVTVDNGTVTALKAIVRSTQHYVKDSFAVGSAPMVSISDDVNSVSLKNVCGWVNVQLTGKGESIKKIEFKGNNNEQLATSSMISSSATISTTDLSVSEVGYAFEKLTLEFDELVTLSSTPTNIYFTMLPVEFSGGFTIKITASDATEMVKSTNKKIKVGRNEIQPMNPFEYAGEPIKIDISSLNTPVFRDLTYTEGYADTFEIKVANNSYQNGYFLFYNPDYHAAGNTLNGEYEIAVAKIGTKFDKKTFVADNTRCTIPYNGDDYYFKSGKVTVSGTAASTTVKFDAVVTNSDGAELPLVGTCTLAEVGYTTYQTVTLESLGLTTGFKYKVSGSSTTIQSGKANTKLLSLQLKCNNINSIYDKVFSTSKTAENPIQSGYLYFGGDMGAEYPHIHGDVKIVKKNALSVDITFTNMKFVDDAGNVYEINETRTCGWGSTNTLEEPGGGW